MLRSLSLSAALLATAAAAEQRSGNATADWIAASSTYQPGSPVQTALRMKIDEGWHTYWINPGMGGMQLSFDWQLPEGWEASDPAYPVPKRFFTGELPGFGYEGGVLFPITLTPPAGADGTVEISLKVSWLTCDDSACVPGSAELTLSLTAGDPAATEHAEIIDSALTRIPRPADGLTLEVTEDDKLVNLTLEVPEALDLDPSACEVFPASASTVDDGEPIQFKGSGTTWTATVTKNQYLDGPVKELTLVLAGAGTSTPVEILWQSK